MRAGRAKRFLTPFSLLVALDGVAQVATGLVELSARLLRRAFAMARGEREERGEQYDQESHAAIVRQTQGIHLAAAWPARRKALTDINLLL